ncbi:MAG: S-layer homology domain-containing protein, partial [Ruminiclostridium sp.]|nr:S-layer homology domain-containing protein [Ruminiclostridium sp.]
GEDCELAANTLRTYEMLLGYTDGTFRPNNTLTRAELSALLVQTMHLSVTAEGIDFADVPADSWYAPYVRAVCAAGYLKGVGGGYFDPQGTVTQEEMITVLGRLAAEVNLYFYQASQAVPEDTGVPEGYSDWAEDWAWLLAASQKNFLGQPLNMLYDDLEAIQPQSFVTRGQIAQVIYNIFSTVDVIKY